MANTEQETVIAKNIDVSKKKSELPSFDFVLDDSPECYQSLRYWGQKTNDTMAVVRNVADGFKLYHTAGMESKVAGDEMSETFSKVAKVFEDDPLLQEPFAKFSDALNRIECYREMFMNQTHLLGVEPLADMVESYKKIKTAKSHVAKQSEVLHIAWEKFSQCPNFHTMQELSAFEKLGHQMLSARLNYQTVLAHYVKVIRENHVTNRVELLHKVLEHMLAQFSFFNFSYQILKEMEPYMSQVFETLQKELEKAKEMVRRDEQEMIHLERLITSKAKSDKSLFPHYGGSQGSFHYSMQSINATTGKLLNKVGGFFSSSAAGGKGKGTKEAVTSKPDGKEAEQEWEVIDQDGESALKRLDSAVKRVEGFPDSHFRDATVSPNNENKEEGSSQFYFTLKDSPVAETKVIESTSPEGNIQDPGMVSSADVLPKTQTSWNVRSSFKKSVDDLTPEEKSEVLRWAESSATNEGSISKRGYLRIRQKAFPKNKFPLLYFIIDKDSGELLTQGQDQTTPTLFCTLLLSAVKECDPEESERNFCFQLITTKGEHTFQALTPQEMKEWMEAIQEAIAVALIKNQERIRTFVRAQSDGSDTVPGSQRKRSRTVTDAAARIKVVDGNNYCADCSAPRPSWASTNIGVVVCIECSGIHRSLGVHVSKVKSLTLDRWTEELVVAMEERGNAKVNSILEGNIALNPKPTRDSSKEERRNFILDKYVEKKFSVPVFSDVICPVDIVDSSESSEDDCAVAEDGKLQLSTTQQSSDSVVCLVEGCEICRSGGHHVEEPDILDNEQQKQEAAVKEAEEAKNESSC